MLLALQPLCLLYTRSIMESAAAGTARLMVTATADEASCRAFAQRQLAAVPDVSIFHMGGPLSWDIELGYGAERDGSVLVSIVGSARPLPVLGVFAGAFGKLDGQGNARLEVEAAYDGRPGWLEGGYGDWISVWE